VTWRSSRRSSGCLDCLGLPAFLAACWSSLGSSGGHLHGGWNSSQAYVGCCRTMIRCLHGLACCIPAQTSWCRRHSWAGLTFDYFSSINFWRYQSKPHRFHLHPKASRSGKVYDYHRDSLRLLVRQWISCHEQHLCTRRPIIPPWEPLASISSFVLQLHPWAIMQHRSVWPFACRKISSDRLSFLYPCRRTTLISSSRRKIGSSAQVA